MQNYKEEITPDLISRFEKAIKNLEPIQMKGNIVKVVGLVLESEGPKAKIGEVCVLRDYFGREVSKSEIVGFKDNRILSMILGDLTEISPGMEIVATGETLTIGVGDNLLGRVLNAWGTY